MSSQTKILHTAEATVTGGRDGHGRTSDGRLEVDLNVPSEMGGTGSRPSQGVLQRGGRRHVSRWVGRGS